MSTNEIPQSKDAHHIPLHWLSDPPNVIINSHQFGKRIVKLMTFTVQLLRIVYECIQRPFVVNILSSMLVTVTVIVSCCCCQSCRYPDTVCFNLHCSMLMYLWLNNRQWIRDDEWKRAKHIEPKKKRSHLRWQIFFLSLRSQFEIHVYIYMYIYV